MLALSTSDLMNSLASSASTIPEPVGTAWKAVGNQATCNMQGFVYQFGLATTVYSACLALHFLLRVRNVPESLVARKVEPIMHSIAILVPLGTALAAMFLDLYNPPLLATGCYLASYPVGCQDDPAVECTRGLSAFLYTFLLAGLIAITCFLVVLVSMALLVWTVRRNAVNMQLRYSDFGNQNVSAGADFRLAQTATQAVLFISAFLMATVWSGVVLVVGEGKSTATYLALTMLAQIFYPLQGFMNFFIFIRPRYINLRRKHPDVWFWTLIAGIFDEQRLSQGQSSNTMQTNPRASGLLGSNHLIGGFSRCTTGLRRGHPSSTSNIVEHTIEFVIDVEEGPASAVIDLVAESDVDFSNSRTSFVTIDSQQPTSVSD